MKELKVGKGFKTLLSNKDFKKFSKYRWYFDGRYAARSQHVYLGHGSYSCRKLYLHREIMKAKPKQEVDHINLNTLDNRRKNLRLVSHEVNMRNVKARKTSKSGFVGVFWAALNNKWRAQITIKGKTISLGLFETIYKAVKARKTYIIKNQLEGFRR